MSNKPRQPPLKLAVFCTSLVGSCLTSSRDVIAACARASLNQLKAPPWQSEPSFFVAALCSCLVLCALCFVLKITSFGQNWLLCARALCFVLGRVRQKDPIFVSRSVCLPQHWSSAPCACFVLCAWRAVTKTPDKHKA
jgi:hypothetical protein